MTEQEQEVDGQEWGGQHRMMKSVDCQLKAWNHGAWAWRGLIDVQREAENVLPAFPSGSFFKRNFSVTSWGEKQDRPPRTWLWAGPFAWDNGKSFSVILRRWGAGRSEPAGGVTGEKVGGSGFTPGIQPELTKCGGGWIWKQNLQRSDDTDRSGVAYENEGCGKRETKW